MILGTENLVHIIVGESIKFKPSENITVMIVQKHFYMAYKSQIFYYQSNNLKHGNEEEEEGIHGNVNN